jgi:hypothetical protein
MLKSTFDTTPPSTLPPGLTRRLQAIPQQVVLCRDIERLYAEARNRAAKRTNGEAPAMAREPAASEHLTNCSRCQHLYNVLSSVLLEPPQPLPQRLFPRLTALAQRPSCPPSRWLQDARYAAAVCVLIATLLTLVVEDATAAFVEVRGSVQVAAAGLARTVQPTSGGDSVQALFEGVIVSLEKNYLDSRQRISRLESSWRTLAHETFIGLEAKSQRLFQKYQLQQWRI